MGGLSRVGQVLRARSRIGLLVTGVAAVLGTQLAWTNAAVAAPVLQPCSASYIGVPGSGQTSASSAEMTTVANWLDSYSAHAGQKLRNSISLSYPAVPWYKYVKPSLTVDWNNLGKSEATGEASLKARINSDRAAASAAGCPNAPILLCRVQPGRRGGRSYR